MGFAFEAWKALSALREEQVLQGQKIVTALQKLEAIMATLDEVLVDVKAETTQITSLSVLTAGLKQQLADALSGVSLPPGVQAKVDAIFSGVESNKQAVVDAINSNTPAAPAALKTPKK